MTKNDSAAKGESHLYWAGAFSARRGASGGRASYYYDIRAYFQGPEFCLRGGMGFGKLPAKESIAAILPY
jgi:hypothetical protein